MRAHDRREQLLVAAIEEFAEHGYHAARTAEIARRAGISQPYVYALYPNKRELFLECSRRVFGRIGQTFADAAREEAGEELFVRLGRAYVRLLANRTELRFQLQAYAATADPDIRARVRDGFMTMFDDVARLSGQPRDAVARFFATGMLLNVAAALELPEDFLPKPTDTDPHRGATSRRGT
jgi:AcrR family transcriptional regulator